MVSGVGLLFSNGVPIEEECLEDDDRGTPMKFRGPKFEEIKEVSFEI